MRPRKRAFLFLERSLLAIAFLWNVHTWIFAYSQQQDRTVSVKLVTDEEFQQGPWKQEAVIGQIASLSEKYSQRFGIRFEIQAIDSWDSDDSRRMLFPLLDDLRKKVGKSGSDVVLGITGQGFQDQNYLGAASYLSGYILLQTSAFDREGRGILEHEIAHLFGAIDLDEPRSIMDRNEVGFDYNLFLEEIIRLHQDRGFDPYTFPLPSGKWDAAIALYSRRKQLNRDEFDLNVMLSLLYLEKKDYPSVEKECGEVLAKNPRFSEVHNILGIALRRQGRIEEAITEYDKALQLQPYHPELHYNLGIAYQKQERYAAAAECYLKTIELHPNYAPAYGNLGFIYLQLDEVQQAIDECRKALEIYPDLPEALSTLGAAWIQTGDYSAAEEVSLKAAAKQPSLAGPHSNLGNIHMQRGDADSAIQQFKLAVTLDPVGSSGFYNLGRAYLLAGAVEPAILAFEQAIRLDQEYHQAYSNLAAAFLRNGRYREAAAASQNALTLSPDYALAHLNLASAYFYLGDRKRAEPACRRAMALAPESPEPYNLLALILESRGEPQEAEEAYQKALVLAPDFLEAHLNLGHFCFKAKNWEGSAKHYLKVLELKPDFPLVNNNLAVVYYYLGKYQEAWENVKKAESLGLNAHPDFKRELGLKLKKRTN